MIHKSCKLFKSPTDERDHVHAPYTPAGLPAPKQVDMRKGLGMPPVLDQGSIGSCASNAASNALRRMLRALRMRECQPSRLFLYWNTRVKIEEISPGEDSGVCIRDVCKALSKYQACDESVWPYVETQFSKEPPSLAYKKPLFKTIAYKSVPQTLDAIKATLAQGLSIITGIVVFESFMSAKVAKTGIFSMPAVGEKELGGHALLLCGYDDNTQMFLALNSWGNGWGQGGYVLLPYAFIVSPSTAFDMWVISVIGSM